MGSYGIDLNIAIGLFIRANLRPSAAKFFLKDAWIPLIHEILKHGIEWEAAS